MSGPGLIDVQGIVVRVRGERTWVVALGNGYQLTGFVGRNIDFKKEICVGAHVLVRLSPFDLSMGRVVGIVDCRV